MDNGTKQESPGSETKDFITHAQQIEGFPVVQLVKNPTAMQETACSTGGLGLISVSGRSLAKENGN